MFLTNCKNLCSCKCGSFLKLYVFLDIKKKKVLFEIQCMKKYFNRDRKSEILKTNYLN